jgi:hypothetical protein
MSQISQTSHIPIESIGQLLLNQAGFKISHRNKTQLVSYLLKLLSQQHETQPILTAKLFAFMLLDDAVTACLFLPITFRTSSRP